MNAKQTIINSIIEYPLLYKDIDFKHSKEKVLDHLFFVNGNGYDWIDGELVGDSQNSTILTFTDNYFETPIWSKEEDEESFLKDFRLEEGRDFTPREIYSKHPLSLYPLCTYAKILNLPKDIKPDWLACAEEAYYLGKNYYDDPYKHCTQFYIKDWLKERNYKAVDRFVKDQRNLLQKAHLKIQALKQL